MRRLFIIALIIFPYFMGFSEEPRYNQPYMRDEWYLYGCGIFNSVDDVSKFLKKYESFLKNERFEDVDGVIINPSAVIWEASREFGVSVELLLFTMQKEQRAVTARDPLPIGKLKKLMGYEGERCGAVHDPSEMRTERSTEKAQGKLFITNSATNTLSIYDLDTYLRIKDIGVGSRPWSVRLRPWGR